MNDPEVSVIIPSYNGKGTVRACLNSVLAQDFKDLEVIVVDCSTDNTPRIIKKEFPGIKLLSFNERISWGKARNIGIRKSRGEYLFFLCIDCTIENDSISRALKLFAKDATLAGLSFSIENYYKSSVIETVDFLLEYYHWLPCQKRKTFAKYMAGTSVIYKKECFLGNMYEDLKTYSEDIILNVYLANKGYQLLFEPSIKAAHINVKKSFYSFLDHQMGIGIGAAVVRQKVHIPYQSIFLKFPLIILTTPLYVIPKMGLTYLIRDDFINFLFFLRHLSLFFIGNFFWAIGFFKEAIRQK